MALNQKISDNQSYYYTSNYRWYYKKRYSENYDTTILSSAILPKDLPVSGMDKKYKIEKSVENRIDMIAHKFYGKDYINLIWIIMLYNNIKNPYEDLIAGRELYIPDKSTIEGRLI